MRSSGARIILVSLAAVFCAVGAAYAGGLGALLTHGHGSPTPLTIRVVDPSRSVVQGTPARYAIRIGRHGSGAARHRRHGSGAVRLSVRTALPRGTTASFSPRSTTNTRSTLTIRTRGATPTRGRRMRLLAQTGEHRSTVLIKLAIRARRAPRPGTTNPPFPSPTTPAPVPGTPAPAIPPVPEPPAADAPPPVNFTIAGDLARPLEPGAAVPLDLALSNPGATVLTISALGVRIAGVSAPRASTRFACGPDDFSVTQFSGAYGFTLAPSSTTRLSGLGVAPAQWPQVAMPDRPVNQNGCKGASLRFAFSGAGGGT